MNAIARRLGAAVVVAASAAAAWAHGGNYPPTQGPDPGPPLGPPYHSPHFTQNDPVVTPGGNDPKVAATRWETWWAANKDAFLRLTERMGGDAPGTTPTMAPSERAQKATEKRGEALRHRLAGLFVEALADKEFEVRTAAAIALGKTGDPLGSEPLRKASSKDEHRDVRDSAVLGLGLLGQPMDIPFLEEILLDESQNPRHRAFAAFALAMAGGEDAAVPLVRFAEAKGSSAIRKKPELAASTFVAMGLTGSEAVLSCLRAASADEEYDENVRSFVLVSLGRMKDRASLQRVATTLASDRDVGLRRAAAVALGRIAAASDESAVNALVTAMNDDRDVIARHFAAASLGAIGGEKAKKSLHASLDVAPDADRAFAALALGVAQDADVAPQLRAALAKDGDESTKGAYCLALGILGDIASAPAIEKAMEEAKGIWLQGYAALALGLVGNTSSIKSLHAKLEAEKDPRLRVNLAISLGMLHDPRARTYLVDTLRGGSTFYERSSAALALGALRATSQVPDLEAVFRDAKEKDILRAFAVVALGEIADASPTPKLTRFAIDGNYGDAQKVDPLNEVLTIY